MIRKKSLAAVVGAAAASLLFALVPKHEGEVLTTYKDPIGINTVCYGDTDPTLAIPGKTYTKQQCLESLERQLIAHAGPVLEILPEVKKSPKMTAAFVSLTYNIGVGNFKNSSVARRFKSGDYKGSCEAISMWNKAGGKVLPGLVKRRADERQMCLDGLADMEK